MHDIGGYMKKRLFTLITLTVISAAIAGCGNKNDNNGDRPAEDPAPASADAVTPVPEKDRNAVYAAAGTVGEYSERESNYVLKVDVSDEIHDVSDMLYGIFFEDINFAADGGLYAEMVQNRSFEFGNVAKNNELHAWSKVGKITAEVTKGDKEGGLNLNNTNYVVLKNESDAPAGIENKGFLEGMAIEKGKNYRMSFYVKTLEPYTGSIYVNLRAGKDIAATGEICLAPDDARSYPYVIDPNEWRRFELELTSDVTAYKNVYLQVLIDRGTVAFDMISLFPVDTYKGRENGWRKDLTEKLEALSPGFVRFPGGCVIEGYRLNLAYDWKDSIGVDENRDPLLFNGTYGDVAARKMGQNIWTDEKLTNDNYPSFMTYGLGFYEFFLLSEDIGAVGVPVLNCGISCMGQGDSYAVPLNLAGMQRYIDDALDLVEFCRGAENTKWGKVRVAMGHREPFELKYICIGNEQFGKDFFSHYSAFVDAFEEAKKKNPAMYGDIELIYSAGLSDGENNAHYAAYNYASGWLKDHNTTNMQEFAGAIDHHYYNSPEWFLSHNDYYDPENYARDIKDFKDSKYCGGINVFLGEYAARSNTLRAALAEASYMTGLERNSDIVVMAAYAPLFGNTTATHWAPDLIWFNNREVTPSVNYYMQQLFSKNVATKIIRSEMDMIGTSFEVGGKVGVATWSTAAKFDNIKIVNNDTGEELAACDFESDGDIRKWTMISDGKWKVEDGALVQSDRNHDVAKYGNTGAAAYFGDASWTNYTYTLEATKLSGSEGFLIPFGVKDENNHFFWNIGGWGNTVSCLQQVQGGAKSDRMGNVKTCKIRTNETYRIKIVVNGTSVKCYLNDALYIDYDTGEQQSYEAYQVAGIDEETGDVIIKLVNVTSFPKTFAIDLKNVKGLTGSATVDTVCGKTPGDDNALGKKEAVTLVTTEVSGLSGKFNYTVPEYSAVSLRIHTNYVDVVALLR